MSANIRETRFCIGFHKQSALQTALVAADCWSLFKTNNDLASVDLATENNAGFIGKDDEFPTQNFLTAWNAGVQIDGFITSEKMALLAAFGLGKVSKATAGDGFKYTCTPLDPLTDGIELPATTYVEAIRQGGSAVLDRALIGIACAEFGIDVNSGSGLASATLTSRWVGCGKVVSPSTITIPAVTAEHRLPSYSAALTILANDYVTTKKFETFSFRWNNNVREGFFPGSGQVSGAQIRGRMEHGDRSASCSFVVRFAAGSDELTNFLAQTAGTAVLTLTGDEISTGVNHKMTLTLAQVVIESAVVGNTDGIVTVAVNLQIQKHSSNGNVKIEVWTDTDEIGTSA